MQCQRIIIETSIHKGRRSVKLWKPPPLLECRTGIKLYGAAAPPLRFKRRRGAEYKVMQRTTRGNCRSTSARRARTPFLIFSHIPKVACSANAIFLFRDQHVRIWSSVNSECLAASTRTVNSRHYGRAEKTYSGGLTHSLVRKQKKQSTAIPVLITSLSSGPDFKRNGIQRSRNIHSVQWSCDRM